ncbi:hypothetical protein Sjap_013495 [Stephania japonica]|uniref:Uncharacterized protein n=1 Tax=Stephania japonica TaxID=461633 RepID=A0AAP0NYN2_9MAGN
MFYSMYNDVGLQSSISVDLLEFDLPELLELRISSNRYDVKESKLLEKVLQCGNGFNVLSPIQSHAWPFLLDSRELISIAKTGLDMLRPRLLQFTKWKMGSTFGFSLGSCYTGYLRITSFRTLYSVNFLVCFKAFNGNTYVGEFKDLGDFLNTTMERNGATSCFTVSRGLGINQMALQDSRWCVCDNFGFEVKLSFEDKVVPGQKKREGTKFEDKFFLIKGE